MKKLDRLDFEILQLLQEDGRRSYTEMAQLLEVSEGTIRARINKMQEEEVFEFIIHTNPNKVGLNVQAIIGIKTQLGLQERVAVQLRDFPSVRFIGAFSGRNDLIIQAYFRSNDELVLFVNHDLSKIEGIISADVSIELKQYKDSFSFIRPDDCDD
ncbi:Lrp/AsnC family transcriptional regulator [Ammoniphilus sp. CFH 90114]|uniref:Lrp/AsnC family transcriptional regulator n=1 Tax=Ammoniphilus sp. CFH 90114 TaxID=2493665 RepID=UPI00100EA325|nr:Lrp/AsnC family transcriptional regulator [Ammoniphilus sp. CFH 90114]RXT14036.1 Lrp/AsnC family transcriptional regulator [Ammoniphilus sp. CFH 90114]